jgi:polyketide cyclase/dehydrase/lipid transport protein
VKPILPEIMRVLKWLGIALVCLVLLIGLVALIGLALPRDHVASRTATFNRPISDVWLAITDVRSFPAWRSSVTRVEVLGQEPRRWREDGSDGTLTLQTVEAREPVRLVLEIADTDLPFGGRWVYDLTPAASGTALTITEQGQVYNPIFRFVSRFVIGHTATIDTYLADLHKKFGGR